MLMSSVFIATLLLSSASNALGYTCEAVEHKGPYLQLAEISGGLFNQWMNLHGNLYAALSWTKETGGTVILPRTAKTRESFLYKLRSMNEIPLTELFDVPHLCSSLVQKGLSICYPGDEWTASINHYERLLFPVRSFGDMPGYTPERTIMESLKLGLDKAKRNVVFVGTGNFGGVEIPMNTSSYFDPSLVRSRDVALTMRFTPLIQNLARKVMYELRNQAAGAVIVGIHLRLEPDWDVETASDAARWISEYKAAVDLVTSDYDDDFVFFLSHGELAPAIKTVVDGWLSSYSHFNKGTFLTKEELNSVCFECQAAIDAKVFMATDHFIGCAPSSFSYVVSEFRNYKRLPFEMIRKPGFNIFYPILSPRTNDWMLTHDINAPTSKVAIKSRLYLKNYPHLQGPLEFYKIAEEAVADNLPTDKINVHTYHTMYGMFLVPMANLFKSSGKRKLKILEIGMGCDMSYGPGKSVAVWKRLLGESGNIWEADYNATCVENARRNKQLDGVRTLVGDQADRQVLKQWIKSTRGRFDVIIDDGGHTNEMIYNSFDILFRDGLKPGGLYFIENLHVGRLHAPYNGTTMTDLIQAWIEQLLVPNIYVNKDVRSTSIRSMYPIPHAVKWIFCQAEACVIAKCENPDTAKCKPGYY